jgi:hypothetical protein
MKIATWFAILMVASLEKEMENAQTLARVYSSEQ